ncbi:MAG: hypothetical protein D8B54_05095 [Catonella sp.]|nr:MAG: hypothetical protein D8B54_05095 [Catonella sp.]
MRLTPVCPQQIEIYFNGLDRHDQRHSRWDIEADPAYYQAFLDRYILADDFSRVITEAIYDANDESIIENFDIDQVSIRNYIQKLEVDIPSEDLDEFVLVCYNPIIQCYPADGYNTYFYETSYDLYLNGQRHTISYTDEDIAAIVLRLYVQWKYK